MGEDSQKVQYYNWQHPIFSSPFLSIMSNKEKKTECDVDNCPGLLGRCIAVLSNLSSSRAPHVFFDDNLQAVKVSWQLP
jgi:hypothetical protein